MSGVSSRLLSALALAALGAGAAAAATGETFNAKTASCEELFIQVQRYGVSDEKREWKKQAHDELLARGPDALRWLLGKAYIKNLWISIQAQELVQQLPTNQAVPVLVEYLGAELPEVRSTAAFFLGFFDKPELAEELYPLLDHEKTCGAALRTLGKWKVRAAVPRIAPCLRHEKERVRVRAANALRDIGDPAAAPALLGALGDPYFTVRNTAARALESMGAPVAATLLQALPKAADPARRQIVRMLGVLKARRAVPVLRPLLRDPDEGARGDAARALLAIDPRHAPRWLQDLPADERASLAP